MINVQPDGYLAIPPGGKGDPVLVLHAWWGLNDTMRMFCTRLADSGFVAFAPDLYRGKVTDEIADAEAFSAALFENLDSVRSDLQEAAAFLIERAGQADNGLAVIGFSLGAFLRWTSRSPILNSSDPWLSIMGPARVITATRRRPTWVTLQTRMRLSRNPRLITWRSP